MSELGPTTRTRETFIEAKYQLNKTLRIINDMKKYPRRDPIQTTLSAQLRQTVEEYWRLESAGLLLQAKAKL